MTVSLRKMTEADSPFVIQWRNADAACFGVSTPLSAEEHYRWYHDTYLNDPRDHMYIVMHDDRPVGTVGARFRYDFGPEVQRVLLGDKKLSRKGVMTGALESMLWIYRTSEWWLKVKSGNIPAIRFYERLGFTESGRSGEWLTMTR